MESTEVIIARLVLGYLKAEQCRSSYKEFLKTSIYLQETGFSGNKFLPTRFFGLNLKDILNEYFEIHKIVQGSLEATNYYNEYHSKTSIVEQLLYLLSKVHSSRTSTPCPRSPAESNMGGTSPSYIDNSDVEATPIHTLPGNKRNSTKDSYSTNKISRRKSHPVFNKPSTATDQELIEKARPEVVAQTLLENKEFHEKMAQTINKIAERQLNQTIKTIVEETEADPIFDKILEEIIDSTKAIDSNRGLLPGGSSNSEKNTSIENLKGTIANSDSSEGYEGSCKNYESQTVDKQSDDAVRSIIANSKKSDSSKEPMNNTDVVLYEGSLDKYLLTTCNTKIQTQMPIQSPLYINPGSLLMVPSNVQTGNIPLDPSKQYYILNKESSMNLSLPALKTPTVITEQDILSMPTVIVNEPTKKATSKKSTLQPPISANKKKQKKLTTLIPKPIIEIGDVHTEIDNEQENQMKENTESSETAPVLTNTTNNVVLPNNSKSFSKEILENDDQSSHHLVEDKTDCKESQDSKTVPVVKTPATSESCQKVTPKSGSHVRNLDFSTPPKITSSHKKSIKSKQSNRSPTFVHKKQAAKTLFKKKRHEEKTNKLIPSTSKVEETKRLPDIWDADLRSIIPKEEEIISSTKITPVKKVKKRRSSKKSLDHLNTTEQDAALLEAALQTPKKGNDENLKVDENNDDIKNSNLRIVQNKSGDEKTFREQSECRKKNQENLDDNLNKMILSPSKLNANKRNLVNTDKPSENMSNDVDEKQDANFITPDMPKQTFHYPIKANRNITPMLETPIKNDTLPKTPGLTPGDSTMDLTLNSNVFTPFSKMLEANLKDVDISSLPTPNIPITPGLLPFTPPVDFVSPYSNRPTDYSTSSSYYQPSDNEQNKSLEANVIEIEKNHVKIINNVAIINENNETINVQNEKNEENNTDRYSVVNEHLNIFNKNVIGKKNLNLVKRNAVSSSSSESSNSSSSESSSEDEDRNWIEKESEETVIYRRKTIDTPKRTYSLRNRNIIANKKDEINKKEIENISNEVANKNSVHRKTNSKKPVKSNSKSSNKINDKQNKIVTAKLLDNVDPTLKNKQNEEVKEVIADTKSTITSIQKNVLIELEEKRLRTINKFKNIESEKTATKKKSGKFMKLKPIPNIINRKSQRIANSPKKKNCGQKVFSNNDTMGDKNSLATELKNGKSALTQQRENSKENKHSLSTQNFQHLNKHSDKSASDVEAQNLIDGLKERGIHLMHNKSPNKKKGRCLNELDECNDDEIQNTDLKENEILEKKDNFKLDSETNVHQNVSSEKEFENSTSQTELESRYTYDTRTFDDENYHIIFNESTNVTKTFEDYNTKVLEKTFIAKMFLEEINDEVDVPLTFSPFYSLLEILPAGSSSTKHNKNCKKSKSGNVSNKMCKKEVEKCENTKQNVCLIKDVANPSFVDEPIKSDDELMNYAVTGNITQNNPDGSESPKSSRKRKIHNDASTHKEKKCKTLLKKINVDTFLNNIYGKS